MKYLYEQTMECGCIVYYDKYLDGCCEICYSEEVDIDHIAYCEIHGG